LCYNNKPVPLIEDGNIERPIWKPWLIYRHKSMESALGFTKLGCISTLLITTLPQACQKCYTQENNQANGITDWTKVAWHVVHNFCDHSWSFTHWYDIYQHERSQQ
jgi:hypothetical protein